MPDGLWRAAFEHLDQVALGVGVVPVVLSTAWLGTTAIHGGRRDAHAFAALLFALVPLLVLQVTSFDLRFTPGQFIQDRYLFYLVPLFAVGCASWLVLRTHVRTKLISAVGAAAAVVALLQLTPDEDTVIFWASPAAAFRPALAEAAARLGLADTTFLQLAASLAVLVIVLLAWRAPRVAIAATASALVAFGALQATYVFERYVEPALVSSGPGQRDWIDAAVPNGSSVALVPGGVDGPVPWWEAEFWNRSVDRELQVAGGETFTPFPVLDVSIDRESGRLVGRQPSGYLVVASGETRFGFTASRTVALNRPLELLRVARPYRLAWASAGLTRDGWMLPGRPVTVRVFGGSASVRRAVQITLASSRLAAGRIGFALAAGGETIRGSVDPGGARPPVDVTVCVPARGHVDVRLLSRGRVQLEHGRTVALHVERISLSRHWPCAVY